MKFEKKKKKKKKKNYIYIPPSERISLIQFLIDIVLFFFVFFSINWKLYFPSSLKLILNFEDLKILFERKYFKTSVLIYDFIVTYGNGLKKYLDKC